MPISDDRFDAGKTFDWGRTSKDYAQYRDIYPVLFYEKMTQRGLCVSGQKVLDVGTGTGVLPRNMYHYGAQWTGTDISSEQIEQARSLAIDANMSIAFEVMPTEKINFAPGTFDVITACQCFWYFDHDQVFPLLFDLLKDGGKLVILSMAWLPFEDDIARASEELVLKYSPQWTGAHATRNGITLPEVAYKYFDKDDDEDFDLQVPFTRDSWHGRMKACRGVGASLSGEALEKWEKEHWALISATTPETFDVLHFASLVVLKKKSQ